MNKDTFSYLLERTQRRLSTWRAEALSFAGRVTLAQSVVAALPTYTMQTTLIPKYVCLKLECMNHDFIWGSRDNVRKCHTIAWDKFCHPKVLGGLGFRDLHAFNQYILMKIGWGLISNPDALWVKVLHSKYRCGLGLIPNVRNFALSSNVWHGVCLTWKYILQGIRWKVGNGCRVRLWQDRWLFLGIILKEVAIGDLPDNIASHFISHYIDDNGEWKFHLFEHLLPPEVTLEIRAFLVNGGWGLENHPIWTETSDDQFSTKSTYNLIMGNSMGTDIALWNVVWKWPGNQRGQCFFWKIIQGGLCTNEFRWLINAF